MRACLAALAAVALVVCGCGPYMITLTELSDFSEPNEDLAGRDVQLVMKDGREARAHDVRLGPVETSGFDVATSERRAVASADVSFVKLRKRGRGALKGLLYGGGGGAAFASAAYWSDPDEPYADLVFLFMPALGALIGIPGGMAVEADVYEFDLAPPRESVVPDAGATEEHQ